MADKFVGFQGTVDEVQWADLMAGIGQKYTLVKGDPVRSTGRTVFIDPRVQIGCGVLFEHDAVKSLTVPAPATGQWHLLVARRVWSSRTVSYVLVAGNVTADAAQTAPPATLPAARNKTVGLTDDEPIAWVHARASVTTLSLWQMSVKRDGRVPGLWAMFDPNEQGMYRVSSEAESTEYVWRGTAWEKQSSPEFKAIITPVVTGGSQTSGWYYAAESTYSFPAGMFASTPNVSLFCFNPGKGFHVVQVVSVTSTTLKYAVARLGGAPEAGTRVELRAWV